MGNGQLEAGMLGAAAAAPATDPLYYYAGLAALVVAMIWGGVLAYRSWEEAHEEFDPATPEELLDAFRQARSEGDLDAEEFDRVRERLTQPGAGGREGEGPGGAA